MYHKDSRESQDAGVSPDDAVEGLGGGDGALQLCSSHFTVPVFTHFSSQKEIRDGGED